MKTLFIKVILFTLFLCSFVFAADKVMSSDISSGSSIASQKSKSNNEDDLFPKRIIAGFLDLRTPNSMIRIDMNKVWEDGYNVVVLAYGEVYGTDIGLYTSDENSKISTQTAIDKVREAKKLGMKILLAVGGVPNTFHPGVAKGEMDPKILGKNLTDEQINTLAKNIVSFLKKYKIDGIEYSLKKYTSSNFIDKLSSRLKTIDPKIIIAAEPEVDDYRLVTVGRSYDYDEAIKNGNIDYLFIQEYNSFPEYDPEFISESYSKIVKNSKIPVKTRILISEPTTAVAGGTNTIYHPGGNATKSLTTEEAVELMLPQLEELKFKPRFAGVAGWSLNTDYAADLYGDSAHSSGSFAKELRDCIYKKMCSTMDRKISGPVVAGFLPLWGKNSSYNISGRQINSTPVDISMPKDKEYCDQNPNICKYNVIIAAYISYTGSKGFYLVLNKENGSSDKVYSSEQLKAFIEYMKSKGKRVIVSVGGKYSHIDWQTVDLSKLTSIIKDYGFDGVNFNLTGSDIPQNKKVSSIAAKKINHFIREMKREDPSFWLTFSPGWHYIVAPLAKNEKDNIYVNHSYIDLLDDIGINNINYILLNTYSEKAIDGILSFYKDNDNRYLKVTPLDGYAKFLASLAWALTTQEGYDVNMPKYRVDKPFKIPANKLIFEIPATEGATHSGMLYVPSKQSIEEAVTLMKDHGASFAGFAIWSVDFDSTNIKQGTFGNDYAHTPWAITNAIADIKLPPVASYVSDEKLQVKRTLNPNRQSRTIDTGVVDYPDKIGSYTADTIVAYQGKEYKCISSLDVRLCNDRMYIPDGLHGDLAWKEFDREKIEKTEPKPSIVEDGETPNYPNGLGNYKQEQVVVAGGKKFECQQGKQDMCNNILYSPVSDKGYLAWSDITNDVTHLANNADQTKPQGAEYIYPNGIESYNGGTIVSVGQQLYRCKVGPESSLCSIEAYSPNGQYGDDAWTKVVN